MDRRSDDNPGRTTHAAGFAAIAAWPTHKVVRKKGAITKGVITKGVTHMDRAVALALLGRLWLQHGEVRATIPQLERDLSASRAAVYRSIATLERIGVIRPLESPPGDRHWRWTPEVIAQMDRRPPSIGYRGGARSKTNHGAELAAIRAWPPCVPTKLRSVAMMLVGSLRLDELVVRVSVTALSRALGCARNEGTMRAACDALIEWGVLKERPDGLYAWDARSPGIITLTEWRASIRAPKTPDAQSDRGARAQETTCAPDRRDARHVDDTRATETDAPPPGSKAQHARQRDSRRAPERQPTRAQATKDARPGECLQIAEGSPNPPPKGAEVPSQVDGLTTVDLTTDARPLSVVDREGLAVIQRLQDEHRLQREELGGGLDAQSPQRTDRSHSRRRRPQAQSDAPRKELAHVA